MSTPPASLPTEERPGLRGLSGRAQHVLLLLAAAAPVVPQVLLPGLSMATAPLGLLALAVMERAPRVRLEIPVLALLAWQLASMTWSVDAGQSAWTVTLWAGGAALLLASRGQERALELGAGVAVAACALSALRQLGGSLEAAGELAATVEDAQARGFAELWVTRHRAMGPFSSPDMLAGFLLPLLGMLAALAAREGGRPGVRATWLALASLGGLVLLMTQSVGAALALGGAVVLGITAAGWRRRRWGTVLLAWLAVAAALALVWWLRSWRPDASAAMSGRERLEDWANAAAMLAHLPPWGVGAGAFESAFNHLSPPRRYAAYVHSGVLQMMVELGPLGGLLAVVMYGALAAWALRWAARGELPEVLAATGVLASILHHQVDYDAHHVAGLGLWIALGWLCARTASPQDLDELPAPARMAAGAGFLAAAWVCAGVGLADRGVPRLPGEEPNLAATRAGAQLLSYDARAQLTLAEEILLSIQRTQDPDEQAALWREHDEAAIRAARLAPWLPAGPMVLARGRFARGALPQALEAYDEAVARACCSRRLHEERRVLAQRLGAADVVEQEERWLRDHLLPVSPGAAPQGSSGQ
ncbi:MAG: O-antigen ligase family protein [Deltaproteobacteria bacterium]|nr:O-antigen ligase family protein [Deltaproteobacteria bacterium]